jgi:hypothetical protein
MQSEDVERKIRIHDQNHQINQDRSSTGIKKRDMDRCAGGYRLRTYLDVGRKSVQWSSLDEACNDKRGVRAE